MVHQELFVVERLLSKSWLILLMLLFFSIILL